MLTLILATLSTGQASGYFYPDVGISALGRGGANVVGADDITAVWYNPAALRRIQGPRFDLDVTAIHHDVGYTRASEVVLDENGEETLQTFEKVENTEAPFPVPAFGFAHNFGLENTTFAFGVNSPMAAPLHSYDEAGPQRYNLVSSEMIQLVYGPAVAHDFTDWLSVGLAVTGSMLRVKQDLDVHMFLPLAGFDLAGLGDPAGDVGFSISAEDAFLLSANAGVLIEPEGGNWALGFSFRPPTTYNASGTIVADFSNHFLYADPDKKIIWDESSSSTMNLIVNMPMSLKAGFLIRPIEALELEADVVWEGWSVNEALVVEDVSFLIDTTIQPVEIATDVELPAGFQDAWSLRLGGQYALNDTVSLRAGGFYEVSAVPTSSLGLGQVDMNKLGYGTGVAWQLSKSISLDASFGQIFFETTEVTDSLTEAVMVNAISGEIEEDATIVGNGIYESGVTLGGLGLSWSFGQ